MPITVTVDRAARRVLQQASDAVTPPEVIAALDRQAEGGGWGYPTLAVYAGVDSAPIAADLRAILDHVIRLSRQHGPRGPVALVVPDNLALFGMFRMYSVIADEQLTVEAFRTIDDAERWLADVSAARPEAARRQPTPI